MARNFRIASVNQHLSTLLLSQSNQRLDALFALPGNHWPHLHALIETVPDTQLGSRLGDRVAEGRLRLANRDRDRDCQAALPGAAECAVADDLGCHLHIGIGKDDDWILCAALALGALSLFSSTGVDVARHG